MRIEHLNYRKVWSDFHGMEIPPNHDIHHKDGDHTNDEPINLRLMPHFHHTTYHRSGSKHSQSTKSKMSSKRIGRGKSDLTKCRMSKSWTEERRNRQADIVRARRLDGKLVAN